MPPWNLLVVLIFCLVMRGFFSIIFAPYCDHYYLNLAGQVVFCASLFGLCAYQFKIGRAKARSILGRTEIPCALQGVVLGCLLLMFTFGENALRTWFTSQTDVTLAYQAGKFHSEAALAHPFFSVHVISYVIACVFFPAIFEEFFFRGLLFPALAIKRSEMVSAILCSFAFMVIHSFANFSVNTLLFSFALCMVYRKTGSLVICISAHAFYNFAAFFIQYYFDFHRTRSIDQLSSVTDWVPQLTMLGVSIVGFAVIVHKNWAFLRSCSFSDSRTRLLKSIGGRQ